MKVEVKHNFDLSQHFLHEDSVAKKFTQICDISADDKIVEIGPGGGFLTKTLVQICKDLTVIEIDDIVLDGYPNEMNNEDINKLYSILKEKSLYIEK